MAYWKVAAKVPSGSEVLAERGVWEETAAVESMVKLLKKQMVENQGVENQGVEKGQLKKFCFVYGLNLSNLKQTYNSFYVYLG